MDQENTKLDLPKFNKCLHFKKKWTKMQNNKIVIYIAIRFIKDLVFPDKTFQTKVTLLSGLVATALLLMYFLPGYQMASGIANNNPSVDRIIVSFTSYAFGLFLMMGSDLQKYYTMKYRPGKLINTGFFKLTRNPNYLGEVLIYNSFAIIVDRWDNWLFNYYYFYELNNIRPHTIGNFGEFLHLFIQFCFYQEWQWRISV